MKSLAILGSTGSIGCSTLQIVEQFPDAFTVKALTGWSRIDRLADQVRRFAPEMAVVADAERARQLRERLPAGVDVRILHGESGCVEAATHPEADMVVAAVVGAAGLMPTLSAIEAGKDIALANKETLVMAGDLVMAAAMRKGVRILPVDSEHSAIFQCMGGWTHPHLSRILLTASGGPFRTLPADAFETLTPEQALRHPTWQMGAKITIDSATLMNKGLEVIEACHLFRVPPEAVEIVVHPQSIVHSMVAFTDGGILAQMGVPDMKGAIAFALSYPERLPLNQPLPDFPKLGSLTFEAPDPDRFPCLSLAFAACRAGGTMPAVMNAANEVAVNAFLRKEIGFMDIPRTIEDVMARHSRQDGLSLDALREADRRARDAARGAIGRRRA
ncbi:MAG: 1-deoxy-D-xylulose-5-phosphate reductoisomerase [Desulfobacterales bacterium]